MTELVFMFVLSETLSKMPKAVNEDRGSVKQMRNRRKRLKEVIAAS